MAKQILDFVFTEKGIRPKFKVGDVLGEFTLVEYIGKVNNKAKIPAFKCECSCGNVVIKNQAYFDTMKRSNLVPKCYQCSLKLRSRRCKERNAETRVKKEEQDKNALDVFDVHRLWRVPGAEE